MDKRIGKFMPRAARILIVKLRKWFPPHDPLASMIARLCILREDLQIEMKGVLTGDIAALDESSAGGRRIYFLRNLIRTQTELSSAIQRLMLTPEFKVLLQKAPLEIQKAFNNAVTVIGKAHPIAKDVRNDICGHVLEGAVHAALERIDFDVWGFLDVGKTAEFTHLKFAGEMTAEMLLKDVTKEERADIASSKFAMIGDLLQTFRLIEICLLMYAKDRGLLPV
jgi:hypothetical protein